MQTSKSGNSLFISTSYSYCVWLLSDCHSKAHFSESDNIYLLQILYFFHIIKQDNKHSLFVCNFPAKYESSHSLIHVRIEGEV